jgi:hypothetical protein
MRNSMSTKRKHRAAIVSRFEIAAASPNGYLETPRCLVWVRQPPHLPRTPEFFDGTDFIMVVLQSLPCDY